MGVDAPLLSLPFLCKAIGDGTSPSRNGLRSVVTVMERGADAPRSNGYSTNISTRRLAALPCGVLLSPMGRAEPKPTH